MKILITDYVHPSLIIRLEEAGHKVTYNKAITKKDVFNLLPEYNGIIINSKIKMDREMIHRNPTLVFIARLGSGMEIVDIPYARSCNIRVINTPEGNCDSVAEHATGMLLALANNLMSGNSEVKAMEWNRERNRGFEIMGKTIGIIGVGHTGSAFAKRLSGFGCRILGYDKYKADFGQNGLITESTVDEILSKADIISFHLPLTSETRHYCDENFIDKCKNGVILLNTSRGIVIDTRVLIKGLASGKIGGACLDVFENEKPETYHPDEKEMYRELMNFSNVIVSPHVAGWTHESLLRIADLVFERILNGYTM